MGQSASAPIERDALTHGESIPSTTHPISVSPEPEGWWRADEISDARTSAKRWWPACRQLRSNVRAARAADPDRAGPTPPDASGRGWCHSGP
ncbi:hypothetical protein FHS12_000448 [Nocardioides albus]|uniref:Uncharacterized protein n=1 Tax=Nocardioides albus TaxID=1841 RepID=A0A7W5A0Z6_9ACTN|nr:hypothetical protein [Nocardioides albus]